MSSAQVSVLARAELPTRYGPFEMVAFAEVGSGVEHLALVRGDLSIGEPLVRVHSECLTGDVLGSRRCDCGDQLDRALHLVSAEPAGVVVYLRGHEGRGIGLAAKVRAYALQQAGLDTVSANLALGLPVDSRSYAAAAALLRTLGVRSVRLLTNNPDKVAALQAGGLMCSEVLAMPSIVHHDNERYLATKRTRLGHLGLAPAEPQESTPSHTESLAG